MILSSLLKSEYPDEKFEIQPLSGGDINEVFSARSDRNYFCVKLNSASRFPEMFEREREGLKNLENSNTIRVPKTFKSGIFEDRQFLIMEFVEKGLRTNKMWQNFGEKLAALHRCSNSYFGAEKQNYIGSLQQNNEQLTSWAEFLIDQRLEPMLKMARDSGTIEATELARFSTFYKYIDEFWPKESPALVHGDLWSGNYLPATNDEACLIDPASYFGHREMDIGMMHLFGGFDNELFNVYNEFYPLEKNWQDRIPYNQLYPLLVHLNLFGRSYWSSIYRIIVAF
jgi:fructosamine-3-kinase